MKGSNIIRNVLKEAIIATVIVFGSNILFRFLNNDPTLFMLFGLGTLGVFAAIWFLSGRGLNLGISFTLWQTIPPLDKKQFLRALRRIIFAFVCTLTIITVLIPFYISIKANPYDIQKSHSPSSPVLNHSLFLSFLFVLSLLQFTIRKKVLRNQTWKKVSDNWLKWSGVSALSVGGFGFIATSESNTKRLLQITSSEKFVDMELLTTIYILSIIAVGLAFLFTLLGKSHATSEDDYKPVSLFAPAFLFAWLSNLGLYSLFFDSLILTMNAHLNS
jgi:hypothetical protein